MTVRGRWWRTWWAPLLQVVVLSLTTLGGAATIDDRGAAVAADLAADRGAGTVLPLPVGASRHAAPVGLEIPALGVHSGLVDLRTTTAGTLAVPERSDVAGWYVGSAHPGDPGPTVIAGHVDSTRGPAVFYRLDSLRAGDLVVVRRADRTSITFAVTRVLHVAKRRFPTALVYGAGPTPSLRLVTCGGAFDSASGHYLDNVIVLAAPVPSGHRSMHAFRRVPPRGRILV